MPLYQYLSVLSHYLVDEASQIKNAPGLVDITLNPIAISLFSILLVNRQVFITKIAFGL